MSDWITVLSFLILGLILIMVEVIFVPGTTIVGILGFCSALLGSYLGFTYFGAETGLILLIGSIVMGGSAFYWGLRANSWRVFALKGSISDRVNAHDEPLLIGDEGEALSDLRPFGKGNFGEQIREVRSLGDYIDAGAKIRIIKIQGTRIVVEKIVS